MAKVDACANESTANTSNAPRSLVDIRNARETRTAEALRIKDEQIRILTEQNNKLLDAIEKGEEEISAIQLEKLHVDDENRQLRESNFSVQSKAKVTGAEFERLKNEAEEREGKKERSGEDGRRRKKERRLNKKGRGKEE